MEKDLKQRKKMRLEGYDYSSLGAYFVTICIKDRKRILSSIIKPSVGAGALDGPLMPQTQLTDIGKITVGAGALDGPLMPQIQLTDIGKTAEKYLLSSKNIPGVKIDRYVIMPNHIHAIIFLYPDEYATRQDGSSKAPTYDGSSRAPTYDGSSKAPTPTDGSSRAPTPTNKILPHIVSTFKRFCNKEIGNNIFQRGFYDHVIRNREDYDEHVKYIYENPMRWHEDELFKEE